MAVVEYSFSNPMKAYKSYSKILQPDQMMDFKSKYEKPVQFKSAQFWVASYTGINVKGIDENAPALAVSNCFGGVMVFPYKYQNFMLRLLDSDKSAGVANAVEGNKVIGPFNWKAVTTNSLLVGYAIAMSNPEKAMRDWDTEDYKNYFRWSQSIKNGKVTGLFIPNYLCPKVMSGAMKHAMLYSKGVLGIGAFQLFDNSERTNDCPTILIPDIEFVTQFDLTSFSALGLGGIYKDYVSKLTPTAIASGRMVACNSPRPASIDLSKSVTPKKEVVADKKVEEKATSINLLNAIGNKLEKAVISDASDLHVLSKKVTMLKDKVECKLILNSTKSLSNGYYPNWIAHANLRKDTLPQFKPSLKQLIYLNFVITLVGNDAAVKVSLGLYGSGLVNVNLCEKKMGVADLVTSFSSVDAIRRIYNLNDSYMTEDFGIQVIDGIHKVVELDGYTRNSIIEEKEDEYKVSFSVPDVGKRVLKITDAKSGLRYVLYNESNEVIAEYTGDIAVTDAVENLVRAGV